MRFHFSIFPLILCVVLTGCYLQDSGGGGSTPDFVSFESDVIPIFDKTLNNSTSCTQTSCHIGTSAAGGLNLSASDTDINTVYTAVTPEIKIDDAESSPLLLKATNETSHEGGQAIDKGSDEYNTISKWISDGAFNDNCDSTPASFATDVTPIFARCSDANCHDSTSPVLTSNAYQNIQDAGSVNTTTPNQSALLRKPLGLDSHGGGVVFENVQDPDYKTIFCWIKNGAQDD